jgi:hypothetical protein
MNTQASGLRGSSVELLTTYSHTTQTTDLRPCRTVALTSPVRAARPSAKRTWSLRERLDEREIAELITAYRNGTTTTTAASLATAHGMSLTSVKRLLRTAGIRRTPPIQQAPTSRPRLRSEGMAPDGAALVTGARHSPGIVGQVAHSPHPTRALLRLRR